jgi:hypothetical protein
MSVSYTDNRRVKTSRYSEKCLVGDAHPLVPRRETDRIIKVYW